MCCKRFNTIPWPLLAAFGGSAVLFSILGSIAATIAQPPYSPDSWSYLDIARGLLADPPLTVATIRQFHIPTTLDVSFPPLFPAVIFVLDRLGLGVMAGYWAAILSTVLCVIPLYLIFRRTTGLVPATAMALLVLSFILTDRDLVEEMMSGRSIPLMLLILLSATAIWVRDPKLKLPASFGMGLCLGLACLTRFDACLIPMVLLPVIWLYSPGRRIVTVGVFALGVGIGTAPWIVHSMANFGKVYVSDNTVVALAAQCVHVADWHTDSVLDAYDAPLTCLAKTSRNLLRLPEKLTFVRSTSFLAATILIVGAAVLVRIRRLPVPHEARLRELLSIPEMRILIIMTLAGLTRLIGPAMSCYMSRRYFAPLMVFIGLTLAYGLFQRWNRTQRPATLLLVLLLVPVATLASADWQRPRLNGMADFCKQTETIAPARCLEPDMLLLDFDNSFAYGALTRRPALMRPQNWNKLTTSDRIAFLDAFRPEAVRFREDGRYRKNWPESIPLLATPCLRTYLILR